MNQGGLIAIGTAYVDINAFDFPLPDEGLQLEREFVGGGYHVEPGGSALSFARLCSSLEIPTTFIGKVGNDEMGNVLSGLLAELRVESDLVVSDSVSTNVSFDMIRADGKNIMTVVGTANKALTADEVYARASEKIASSSYLYLGGCFKLKNLMPAFLHLAKDAKAAGTKVVVDHGRVTEGMPESEKEIVRQLVSVADVYLPSVDEFLQLWNVSSVDEGLGLLRSMTNVIVVVKNGEEGAITSVDDKVVTVPAFSVKILHTVGAGDSFNAGFIAAQYKGEELITSIKFGCATAALKISQKALPVFDDVAQLIANQST